MGTIRMMASALVIGLGLCALPALAEGEAAQAPAAKGKAHTEKAKAGNERKGKAAGDNAAAKDAGAKRAEKGAAHEGKGAAAQAPAREGKGAGNKGEGRAARTERRTGKTEAAVPPPVLGDAQTRIDKRQEYQTRRIEGGVKRGSLTPDELAKLQSQQKAIADMEAQFAGDGALTKEEVASLRRALNDASLQIWTEKRDTDGVQQPVVRLGKDIFLSDATAARLESPDLTRQEARAFTRDFARTLELRRQLATENLPEDQRATLEAEYNDLLTKYFVVKATVTTTAG